MVLRTLVDDGTSVEGSLVLSDNAVDECFAAPNSPWMVAFVLISNCDVELT